MSENKPQPRKMSLGAQVPRENLTQPQPPARLTVEDVREAVRAEDLAEDVRFEVYRAIPSRSEPTPEDITGAVEKVVSERTKDIADELNAILDAKGEQPAEMDSWVENGELKTAPKVDPEKFGGHSYPGLLGPGECYTSNCKHGCGCWMGAARSGGPVNPFGECPKNPKTLQEESHLHEPTMAVWSQQSHETKQAVEAVMEPTDYQPDPKRCEKLLEEAGDDDRESGEKCQACGNRYRTIYRVPNEVWAEIAPDPESLGDCIEHQYGGLLCPACADKRARENGITLYWDSNDGDWKANVINELKEQQPQLQPVTIERIKGSPSTYGVSDDMEYLVWLGEHDIRQWDVGKIRNHNRSGGDHPILYHLGPIAPPQEADVPRCPWCGCDMEFAEDVSDHIFWLVCGDEQCLAESPVRQSEKAAIEAAMRFNDGEY